MLFAKRQFLATTDADYGMVSRTDVTYDAFKDDIKELQGHNIVKYI